MNDQNRADPEQGLAAHSDSFDVTAPPADEHLRHNEQQLQALYDIAPATMLWASAPSGECTFISGGWHEYTGIPPGEALGMRWLEAIHAADRQELRRRTEDAKAERRPFVLDHRMRHADGEYRWVQSAGRPRLGANGEFLGFVGSVVDIHERKLAEQALRDNEAILAGQKEALQSAMEALKDTNRRKDEFLAVLGHELRNPLAPLSTAADLLEFAEERPDVVETVRPMMRRQIDHLTRLVDDLLDVSRISRGHAALQRAPLDLRAAVQNAIEQSEPLIAARRHRLSVHLGDVVLRADGDFQRLTQVFVNLLSNAAKYSEPGSEITVHAAQDGDAALICVADSGFGIPQERVQEVFEMFSQVPEHRSLVGSGGLGIGLALCRQLGGLHGGVIAARSEGLGTGSEFSVRLPLASVARDDRDDRGAAVETRTGSAPRRRVLVVDDNADAATALCMVLEMEGHDARAVFSGPAALEALAEFAAEVVLLDLGMPQMDGFEVARRIRQLPNGRQVLLVALTGWGQDQDRQGTAEAGFDEHLTKPVDATRLSMLLTLEGGDGSPTKRAGPTAVFGSATGKAQASRRPS